MTAAQGGLPAARPVWHGAESAHWQHENTATSLYGTQPPHWQAPTQRQVSK